MYKRQGDESVSPLDALVIINRLNSPVILTEGESPTIAILYSEQPVATRVEVAPVSQSAVTSPTYTNSLAVRTPPATSPRPPLIRPTKTNRCGNQQLQIAGNLVSTDLERTLDMIADDVAAALIACPD